MCGIAGIWDSGPDTLDTKPSKLSRLLDGMKHRGPDDSGFVACDDGKLVLGHRRLSIVDLSSHGHQPMVSEDGSKWIVFNGEIYNYPELRSTLSTYRYSSHADTEVILALYCQYGSAGFAHLRGMFAFALWDGSTRSLFLVRDAAGIKPLYYILNRQSISFCSELRPLVRVFPHMRQLDSVGLATYLRTGSVGYGSTIVSGIHELSRGIVHRFQLTETGLLNHQERLSVPQVVQGPTNRNQATERLAVVLKDSVQAHLLSDVPIGLFLSGGLDSTVLAVLAGQAMHDNLHTFTVNCRDSAFSESNQAKVTADAIGSTHYDITLSAQDLLDMLPSALAAMDQPSSDGINTYVISNMVSSYRIKVALSGIGGDELFGGYPSFQRLEQVKVLQMFPRALRKAASRILRGVGRSSRSAKFWQLFESSLTPAAIYNVTRQLFSDVEIAGLLHNRLGVLPPPFTADGPSEDAINHISLMELNGYMTNTLLRDADSMGMANSVEVRVPFVDRDVIAFSQSVPGEWKVSRGRRKPLLFDSVDTGLVRRDGSAKLGFTLPFQTWLLTSLKKCVSEVLTDPARSISVGIDPSVTASIWEAFINNPAREHWVRPWSLYVLLEWCRLNNVSR